MDMNNNLKFIISSSNPTWGGEPTIEAPHHQFPFHNDQTVWNNFPSSSSSVLDTANNSNMQLHQISSTCLAAAGGGGGGGHGGGRNNQIMEMIGAHQELLMDGGDQEEGEELEEEEELGAVKEMMFKIAAMQPVDIDPATVRKPKRRNVRISDDPQSVAARLRRERISEKIRILQRLVPGGTKMDTASMLDEAIRYVKFLKRQIRLLQLNHHPPPPAANWAAAAVTTFAGNVVTDDPPTGPI